MTNRYLYPIQCLDECFYSLGKSNVFSSLDTNSGYRNLEIDDKKNDKIVFTSRHGLYQLIVMLFGLKNAAGTFQRAVDVIRAPVQWQKSVVYLEDVVAFSKTPKEHNTHVKQMLALPPGASVT